MLFIGNQFLKTITGFYATIIGLPMFQVRESLEKLGFIKHKEKH